MEGRLGAAKRGPLPELISLAYGHGAGYRGRSWAGGPLRLGARARPPPIIRLRAGPPRVMRSKKNCCGWVLWTMPCRVWRLVSDHLHLGRWKSVQSRRGDLHPAVTSAWRSACPSFADDVLCSVQLQHGVESRAWFTKRLLTPGRRRVPSEEVSELIPEV